MFGIFLVLLIQETNPLSIRLLRELENILLRLKLGYWSTRPGKDKVPELQGHTPASYYVISPTSLYVY